MRKLAERWLSFAEKDLVVARQLLEQPQVYDIAAFHCQQATEKSLKGLLVLHGSDVPRIHDLARLYALAGRTAQLDWDMEALDVVNEFYIETRYPLHEDHDPLAVSLSQLERMLELAQRATNTLRRATQRAAGTADGTVDR